MNAVVHLIENGDPNHHPNEARCSCGWRVVGPHVERSAWAHLHIAEVLSPGIVARAGGAPP